MKYSLVKDRRVAFANLLSAYFRFNVASITSTDVTKDGNLLLNGQEYKLDVSDYTGYTDKYVFYNPSNGRIVVDINSKRKTYQLDVGLIEND